MTFHYPILARIARFICCLIFVLATGTFQASAQQFVVAPFNFNIQNGSYTPASTNAKVLAGVKMEIPAQTFMQKPDPDLALIYPQPGGILLFKSMKKTDPADIAGKLVNPSLAIVDTIFHNQVYSQRIDGQESFTFDLWYSVVIDGKRYYTDFRPHTLDYRYPLVYHNQLFMLASQETGYEMYADKGYPEHFHIAVFDMQNGGIQTRFVSEELPFHYGNEFLDESDNVIKSQYNEKNHTFSIEIEGLNETYKGVWDGSELKHLN